MAIRVEHRLPYPVGMVQQKGNLLDLCQRRAAEKQNGPKFALLTRTLLIFETMRSSFRLVCAVSWVHRVSKMHRNERGIAQFASLCNRISHEHGRRMMGGENHVSATPANPHNRVCFCVFSLR